LDTALGHLCPIGGIDGQESVIICYKLCKVVSDLIKGDGAMPPHEALERSGTSFVTTRHRLIKFSPERLDQIKNLVERGKSREEIADILAVTVGSLQVTCWKMGISLRRPNPTKGVCLLKKREPLRNATIVSHNTGDPHGLPAMRPPEQEAHGTSHGECGVPAPVVKRRQEPATTLDARTARFMIKIQYNGMEGIAELPLTLHTIGQLALEAAIRNVKISELIAELIVATLSKDLFPQALDNIE
jgi:hypothetical protein